MTPNIFLWILLTGGITGAAWMGIVLMSRYRRLTVEHRELLEDRQRTLDELEAVSNHVSEMQDRLDFVERHLKTLRAPPPSLPEG